MKCSVYSWSDYDKKIIDKIKKSKLLIIDLDGTLIDFEKVDNAIVSELFGDNKVINFIDNILWKVNRLDVFGNGYSGLKIRLAVYSLFTKRYTYKECKRIYAKSYAKYASIEVLAMYYSYLSKMIENGYKIVIVTKNVYAKEILTQHRIQKTGIEILTLRKQKKENFKKMIDTYKDICIIGNNLCDDIISSFRVGAPYIYVGKSVIVCSILKMVNFISAKMSLKKLCNNGIQVKNFKKVANLFLSDFN